MKIAGILLLLLAITVTSQAQGFRKKVLQKLDELGKKVDELEKGVKVPYVKLNSAPVCFGSKNGQFGSFTALEGGDLMKLKLVHLYGYISCYAPADYYWSHWGCGYHSAGGNIDYTGVSFTDASNHILLPPSKIAANNKWALIPGYSSRSPEIVMSIYDTAVKVNKGDEYRLWYTEDLTNGPEGDNGGRVCADVYGYLM